MNQNVYGFTTSGGNYFPTAAHGTPAGVSAHSTSTIFYPPVPQQNIQAGQANWSYSQIQPQVQQPSAGLPVNVNCPPGMAVQTLNYTQSHTSQVLQSSTVSDPMYHNKTNQYMNSGPETFGEYTDAFPFADTDINGNEIYLGQPVMHPIQPPDMTPAIRAAPTKVVPPVAQRNDNNNNKNGKPEVDGNEPATNTGIDPATKARQSTAPVRKRSGKVLDDEDEDEEEDDEVSNENSDDDDDPSKDPSWSEPEDEDEDDEFVPEPSGSDEDYVVSKRRRKSTSKTSTKKGKRKGSRVTRSLSKSSSKRETRSTRRSRYSVVDDDDDDDDDDDEDDMEVLPIRRGQPSLSAEDSDDKEYIPKTRKPARVAVKRRTSTRRMRPVAKPVQILPEKVFDDSDNEEIALHEGQPVTNRRTESKCVLESEVTVPVQDQQQWLSESDSTTFLVERESAEAIKQIPPQGATDEHCIWELQSSLLRKYTRMKGTNQFQATSSYLGRFGNVQDRCLPVTVQRTKGGDVKIVRVLGVMESFASADNESSESIPGKRKRGRPSQGSRSATKPKPARKTSARKRRGRRRISDVASDAEIADDEEAASVEDAPTLSETDCSSTSKIFKDYVEELLVALTLDKDRTDFGDNSTLESQLNDLKQRLLDNNKPTPDYLAALSRYPVMVVVKCSDDRQCQALLDNSDLKADRIVTFTSNKGDDDDEVKFFVSQDIGERSKMWHTVHNYRADVLEKSKMKLQVASQAVTSTSENIEENEEQLTSSERVSKTEPSEQIAKAALADIIDQVECICQSPPASAAQVKHVLEDRAWIDQLLEHYEAIIATANNILEPIQ